MKLCIRVLPEEAGGSMGRLKAFLEKALEEYGEGTSDLQLLLTAGKNRGGPNPDAVRVYYSGEEPLARELSEVISALMGTEQPPELRRLRDTGPDRPLRLTAEHSSAENPRSVRWLSREENLGRLADGEAALLAEYFGWEPLEMRYERVKDLDRLSRPTVEKLLERNWLLSRGGTGEDRIIDLGEDALRLLTVMDRAGLFDR